MLAPTQAALEDLFVPNKFADACSCNHINPGGIVLDAQQVAIQCCSTNGYEDFHVDSDTDERVTHLDEFVGPLLEPQLSTLTMRASSRKLSNTQLEL